MATAIIIKHSGPWVVTMLTGIGEVIARRRSSSIVHRAPIVDGEVGPWDPEPPAEAARRLARAIIKTVEG